MILSLFDAYCRNRINFWRTFICSIFHVYTLPPDSKDKSVLCICIYRSLESIKGLDFSLRHDSFIKDLFLDSADVKLDPGLHFTNTNDYEGTLLRNLYHQK